MTTKPEENPIVTAIEFINKLKKEDEAFIMFKRKDGIDRIMKCTLNFDKIPEEHKPKEIKLESILNLIKKKILHVYDLENLGWRSIPVDKTQWIEIKNEERQEVDPNFWKK